MSKIDAMSADGANLPDNLGDLARKINGILEREAEVGTWFDDELNKEVEEHCRRCEDIALRKSDAIKDLRLEAGHLLIAAKTKVAPGKWREWLHENIQRSVSDCYQCMKMAGADSPDREREKEKADTRARVQKHRDAKRAKASVTGGVTDASPITLPREIVQNAPLRSHDAVKTTEIAAAAVLEASQAKWSVPPGPNCTAAIAETSSSAAEPIDVPLPFDNPVPPAEAEIPTARITELEAALTEAHRQIQRLKNEIVGKNLQITKLKDDLAVSQRDAAVFRKAYEEITRDKTDTPLPAPEPEFEVARVAQPEPPAPSAMALAMAPDDRITMPADESETVDTPIGGPSHSLSEPETSASTDDLSPAARDALRKFEQYTKAVSPGAAWLGFEDLRKQGIEEDEIDELLTAGEIVYAPNNEKLVGIEPDWMRERRLAHNS